MNTELTNSSELITPTFLFKPTNIDQLSSLFEAYDHKKNSIIFVSDTLKQSDNANVIDYFVEGNVSKDRYYTAISYTRGLFDSKGAIKALDAAYWSRAMQLTDVYDAMPQDRRDEWNDNIKKRTTPSFTSEVVLPTLQNLLNSRLKFLAERVDGVFKCLSGTHVTNSPFGFSKRMIINYVMNYYGLIDSARAGSINDLRSVIGRFSGRGEIAHYSTYQILDRLLNDTGVWHELDGGAIKIKLYKKGTVHLEVHPDMAWRLNEILATLYPKAIPSSHREAPKFRPKSVHPLQSALSYDIINALAELRSRLRNDSIYIGSCLRNDDALKQELVTLLKNIGASYKQGTITFDYSCESVLDYIIMTGCIPEKKSHQAYFTPNDLRKIAFEHMVIEDHYQCLEPQAGQGALADLLPKEQTTCIELSPLNCKILEGKGYTVECTDFLRWALRCETRYDLIFTNPPYTKNQAKAHIEAAAKLLSQDGLLVAILPASLKDKALFPGFLFEWSQVYHHYFQDTAVSVVILTLKRE